MSLNLAALLSDIDAAELGRRVRCRRAELGLAQRELAGADVTIGYVSRIETGARRPSLAVLTTLAERLDVSAEQLLLGVAPSDYDEIRLGLDYAELALESGEAVDAERQAREHLARAEQVPLADLVQRGRFLLGRSLEALGKLDQAIDLYEQLLTAGKGLFAIECGIALSRCYRESDDLTMAIEVGERVQAAVAEEGLADTEEAIKLAVTVALAYAYRGDLARATRIAADSARRAEKLELPAARAAAYWNASVFRAERGEIAEAAELAGRALALFSEGRDARNMSRLRLQLGDWQLQQDPPLVDEGLANIERGRADMAASSATKVEMIEADIALARALMLTDDPYRALELASAAQTAAPDRGSITFIEASIVRAQALTAVGMTNEAEQVCRDVVEVLSGLTEPDRATAQAWFELADMLSDLGVDDLAWQAVRNAAAATGLRSSRQRRDVVKL